MTRQSDGGKETTVRALAIIFVAALASWSAISAASAQSDSCKKCAEQKRAYSSAYSGPTCQTEYDRCMKSCKQN
jgi:hypothetical protein